MMCNRPYLFVAIIWQVMTSNETWKISSTFVIMHCFKSQPGALYVFIDFRLQVDFYPFVKV